MATRCLRSIPALVFVLFFGAALLAGQTFQPPQSYTLTEVSHITEASMFTGQASNLKVFRSGSKELVELTIPPWPASPTGVHISYLFDFQAHKAYTKDQNTCSWMKYVSQDAPVNYDPVTGSAQLLSAVAGQGADATRRVVGTEIVNGIAAKVEELSGSPGQPPAKVWIAEKGDFVVRLESAGPDGKEMTFVELQQISLTPPAAALFAAPSGCTEVQGEWSDTGVNAHASIATQTSSEPQGSGASQDYVNAIYPPNSPSTASCTVWFRIVRGEAMEPVTGGFGAGLDLSQNPQGGSTIGEGQDGTVHFWGGTVQDVTSRFQSGILRIDDPPPHFELDIEFAQKNGGSGHTAHIYRQCLHPKTVLLLVIHDKNDRGTAKPDDWLWVNSGKMAEPAQ